MLEYSCRQTDRQTDQSMKKFKTVCLADINIFNTIIQSEMFAVLDVQLQSCIWFAVSRGSLSPASTTPASIIVIHRVKRITFSCFRHPQQGSWQSVWRCWPYPNKCQPSCSHSTQQNSSFTHINTTLDLLSKGRGFDSLSGCYQVVSTWMDDCLWTGKLGI